jgi:phospholipid N-methyltransferase
MSANFLSEFFLHPREIGAVTESSKFLARTMAKPSKDIKHVVEFGAGTGPVTTEILKILPEDGRLTCFEVNPKFCRKLEEIKDNRLKIINDGAENCSKYVDNLDCIISGLPLTVFTDIQREEILSITGSCKKYIQLQYTPVLGKKIKKQFKKVTTKFVPLNIPPAFVYVCSNED